MDSLAKLRSLAQLRIRVVSKFDDGAMNLPEFAEEILGKFSSIKDLCLHWTNWKSYARSRRHSAQEEGETTFREVDVDMLDEEFEKIWTV